MCDATNAYRVHSKHKNIAIFWYARSYKATTARRGNAGLGYWGRGSGGEDNNVGNIRVLVVKHKKSDFVIKTIQDLVHPPPFFSYN